MRAYLAGAIEYASDEGSGWRKDMSTWLKEKLGHEVFNPVIAEPLTPEEQEKFRSWRLTNYSRFKKTIRKVINHDLNTLIHKVDYVICYWNRGVLKGGGTHGEVTTAYHHNIPVYLVLGMKKRNVSSWILGCSTQEFDNFNDLKNYLLQTYGK